MSGSEPAGTRRHGWQRGRGWGWIWGEDDQIGALNALTDETRLAALRSVTRGRIYDLGLLMDRNSYLSPAHVGTEVVTYRTPDGLIRQRLPGFEDPDGVGFQTSMIVISDHAGTQLDGLSHATFGSDRHWYNGFTAEEWARDFGPVRAGGECIPPVIASAVLIDVSAYKGVDDLGQGHPIAPDDLQGALDRQGIDIEPGEVVLVRTGALRHWGMDGADHDRIAGPDTAGITLASARWLVEEKGAILIASDTSALEVVPPVDGDNAAPVHKYLLVDQGVQIGELHYLEDLAADRVYRFCYVALAPKVRGTTAGFALRPVALT